MSKLHSLIPTTATWGTDRAAPTPLHYAPPETEAARLATAAGLVDLTHYAVIEVAGPQRVEFLHPVISNQIRRVSSTQTIHAGLFTPQGRFLWEFAIVERGESFLLCTAPDRVAGLHQKLNMYLLRSKATVRVVEGFALLGVGGPRAAELLAACFPMAGITAAAELGATFRPDPETIIWRDPRHSDYGWRLLVSMETLAGRWQQLAATIPPVGFAAWEHQRIVNALPRVGNELIPEETLPLEVGFWELHGVDFNKGCYIGQETTARTKHRGTIKRRLYSLRFPPGAELTVGSELHTPHGRECGKLTSFSNLGGTAVGLGVLRSGDLEGVTTITAGTVTGSLAKPEWAEW